MSTSGQDRKNVQHGSHTAAQKGKEPLVHFIIISVPKHNMFIAILVLKSLALHHLEVRVGEAGHYPWCKLSGTYMFPLTLPCSLLPSPETEGEEGGDVLLHLPCRGACSVVPGPRSVAVARAASFCLYFHLCPCCTWGGDGSGPPLGPELALQ